MSNIAIISSRFLPSYGGVEQYSYQIATELTKRGHQVSVFSTLEPNSDLEEIMSGFSIHRFKSIRIQNGRLPWLTEKNRFLEKLSNLEPDFLLIQSRLYNMSVIAAEFAAAQKISAAIVEHGTNWVQISNSLVQYGSIKYEKYLLRRIKRTGLPFYAVSKAGLSWLQKIGINGKGVLYNAVSPNYVQSLSQDHRCKKKNSVLFCGRLVDGKGLTETIEAVVKLHAEGEQINLTIVGDGPLKAQIPDTDYIEFKGKLEHKELYPLMAESDLFCIPSYSEGFPTVILEAILCRTLVLASRAGGIPEMIIDEETGFLLPEITIKDVKNGIKKAMNSNKKQQIINNAERRVLDNFTWTKTADNLLDVINELIKKHQ